MPYKVIYEDFDTRILEFPEDYFKPEEEEEEEKFDTYKEAQSSAVEYLERLIKECQETLMWIKKDEDETDIGI